jgi:hypothetical protein
MNTEKKTPDISEVTKAVQLSKPGEFKLPSLQEIYSSTELTTLQKDSALQVILNSPPDDRWLKDHPTARKKAVIDGREVWLPIKFMPIERVEWLLTVLFLRWRVEIIDSKLVANSVQVTIRLHYFDHALGEWNWTDGIGAQPLQIDSGSGAIEFNKMKSSAVQMAAPAAKSYAIKDAAETLGKIFGKDMNRAEVISYEPLRDKYKSFTDAATTDNK